MARSCRRAIRLEIDEPSPISLSVRDGSPVLPLDVDSGSDGGLPPYMGHYEVEPQNAND